MVSYATESQKFHWFSNLYKRKQSVKQQFISQLVMLLFFLTRSSHFLQSLLSLDKDSRHVAQTTSRCLIFKEKVHTFHIFNLPLCVFWTAGVYARLGQVASSSLRECHQSSHLTFWQESKQLYFPEYSQKIFLKKYPSCFSCNLHSYLTIPFFFPFFFFEEQLKSVISFVSNKKQVCVKLAAWGRSLEERSGGGGRRGEQEARGFAFYIHFSPKKITKRKKKPEA